MKVSPSKEDYLERIQALLEKKGFARVSDIASELHFTRPSVTSMIQQLSREGYIDYEKYRGFTLTPRGKQVAQSIRNRHAVLEELFHLIGVDQKTAEKDVEGIEHYLSETSLKKIKALVVHLKSHPITPAL